MADGAGTAGLPPGFIVSQVPVSLTLALRHEVLGAPGAEGPLVLTGDDEPTTLAFAALGPGGEVWSVARLSLEMAPFSAGHPRPHHRLRGMATGPAARNQGLGTAVLRAIIDWAASQGDGLLWCNARTPAVGFYRRCGFVTHGECWFVEGRGPHVVMWRPAHLPPVLG